jgi:hypothetical protein
MYVNLIDAKTDDRIRWKGKLRYFILYFIVKTKLFSFKILELTGLKTHKWQEIVKNEKDLYKN